MRSNYRFLVTLTLNWWFRKILYDHLCHCVCKVNLSICLCEWMSEYLLLYDVYFALRLAKYDSEIVNSAHKSKSIWNPVDGTSTTQNRFICIICGEYRIWLKVFISLVFYLRFTIHHLKFSGYMNACVLSVPLWFAFTIASTGNYNLSSAITIECSIYV